MREVKKKPAQKGMTGMNVVDHIVSYFNPAAGVDRLKNRQFLSHAGGYTSGRKTRRSFRNWNPGAGSADSDILPDLPVIREFSRDLIRNQPLAAGAINTVVTNVLGGGLKLRSRINRNVLNLSSEAADAWEAKVMEEFAVFSKTVDIRRKLCFEEMQDLVFRSSLENGDIFTLRRHHQNPGDRYALKLSLVESDRVCNEDFKADNENMSGGIKFDRNGAAETYYITSHHPGDYQQGSKLLKWRKIPAWSQDGIERMVLHHYTTLRVDQSRGVPYLAPVIEHFKQLGEYSDAEISAAVLSAMFTVFVKSDAVDEDKPLVSGAQKSDARGDVDEIALGKGAIIDLNTGESIETANPGRPNAAFDPFVQAILRQIGVALEIPFELLVKHFTASYSASRASLEMAWQFFRKRRKFVENSFCNPVYEWFLTEAVARRMVSAPGFFEDPLIRQAYLGAEWAGDPKISLDPVKDAKSDKLYIDMGATTIERVAQDRFGHDWERIHHQQKKEQAARLADGLVGGSEQSNQKEDSTPPQDEKED